MIGEFAIIGEELKDKLVEAGCEIVETKQGKYCKVYYFTETCELLAIVDDYLDNYL